MTEYIKIPNIYKREEFGKNRLLIGEYSSPELEYLAGCEWEWTEKVDGTNVRVCWDGYRVEFRGRTDKAQLPKGLVAVLNEKFGGPDKEELFEQTFGQKEVILFGEGCGGNIQGNNGYGDFQFILFDVMVGDLYLERQNMWAIATIFDVRHVPYAGSGTLIEAEEYIRSHPMSSLRDGELEGIVCRPMVELKSRRGDRLIVKIKCRDFPKEDG